MNILFKASWADWEEWWEIKICRFKNKLYLKSRGYSVLGGKYSNVSPITDDEALEEMIENEKFED